MNDLEQAKNYFFQALEQQEHGNLAAAEDLYRKALQLAPERESLLVNLSAVLLLQEAFEESRRLSEKALQLNPGNLESWLNLARSQGGLGDTAAALASLDKVLALRPDYPEAINNKGALLLSLDRPAEALECFDAALALRPDYPDALTNRARTLRLAGRADEALEILAQLLARQDTPETRSAIVACLRNLRPARDDGRLRHLLIRAITEPWCSPGQLVRPGLNLVKLDPRIAACIERANAAWPLRLPRRELFGGDGRAALAGDLLLRAILRSDLVGDIGMERLLTLARTALLEDVETGAAAGWDDATLDFHCALAEQCFFNDYVYVLADGELERAHELRQRLVDFVAAGVEFAPALLIAVAAYFPPAALPAAPALLDRGFPAPVETLLTRLLREPLEEAALRGQTPRLTEIGDGTSTAVRRQYEENPYPRWARLPPPGRALSLGAWLRRMLPRAPIGELPAAAADGIDVLIAGCGTGQQSIVSPRQVRGARVLAVDLSLSSLAYAQRKSQELGATAIGYAQADIMRLGGIDRSFDLIECVGVLHHLADPMAGWRVLLSLLRPGGIMRIALYSENARQVVVAARRFIAERGYTADADGIRRCRQDLTAPANAERFAQLLTFRDFYSASECRDLLFHVQEHRFTLPQLKACLAELGLVFLGFDVREEIVRAYAERFPEDTPRTDLDRWDAFESAHPTAFVEMYQFYVQKPRRAAAAGA